MLVRNARGAPRFRPCGRRRGFHGRGLPTVKRATSVVAAARASPLFVLMLARPEVHDFFPSLAKEASLEEFRLAGLGLPSSERLAREMLGPSADPAVVRLVAERAGGNGSTSSCIARC